MRGVQLIDISLRGLHVKRQSPLSRPFVAAFQRVLRETDLGKAFFGNVATARVRWQPCSLRCSAGRPRRGQAGL